MADERPRLQPPRLDVWEEFGEGLECVGFTLGFERARAIVGSTFDSDSAEPVHFYRLLFRARNTARYATGQLAHAGYTSEEACEIAARRHFTSGIIDWPMEVGGLARRARRWTR